MLHIILCLPLIICGIVQYSVMYALIVSRAHSIKLHTMYIHRCIDHYCATARKVKAISFARSVEDPTGPITNPEGYRYQTTLKIPDIDPSLF